MEAVSDQYSFRVHVDQVENGQYLATSDELPGLVAQGRTVEETLEIAGDVARRLVESYREYGDQLPESLKRIETAFDLDIAVTA
jgi:predicted RNase H-like HicB family nuclease